MGEPVTANALVQRIQSGATIVGELDRPIHGVAPLNPGCRHALSFCDPESPTGRLHTSESSVVVVSSHVSQKVDVTRTLIVVDDPRAWFLSAVDELFPEAAHPPEPAPGVDTHADVHANARISPSAAIGTDVHIGSGTRVGAGAVIYSGVIVGTNCVIGPGAIIGWVGLAYHEDRQGSLRFVPHLGTVRIGDWVDVGAHVCVCRGILSDTIIGNRVKIGSLVYIGHGTVIENRVWISASTAIAGHSRIGEGGLIGIGSTMVDNVTMEPDVLIAAGSVVTRDAQAGAKLAGVPANPHPKLRRFGPTPR
ncbi:MAG: LpxD N-terminal domain-containing protein [Casimicrobiaceae bacterium]